MTKHTMPAEFDGEYAVAEFIRTFGASVDFRLWVKLIQEETRELLDAMREEHPKADILKEVADIAYVVYGSAWTAPEEELLTDEEWAEAELTLDEATDAIGHAVNTYGFGHNVLSEAFYRVHQSNMSKLGDDGKPIRREDGKIMKGPNYKAPDLTDLV